MFPRLVKRSFLLIVQIGVVLVILQHSHSSLLRSCFFFFFFFFVRAALMLQSQQFGGKQAVADFTDYFLPSDWRCRSPKSAALGFFFGSGNNKKNLPTHNAFKRDPKKKNDPPEMHQNFFKGCLFPHCFIFFFFLINHSWQVSQLTISSESWMPRQTTAVIIVNITTHFHQTNLKNATSLSSLVNISLVLPPSN